MAKPTKKRTRRDKSPLTIAIARIRTTPKWLKVITTGLFTLLLGIVGWHLSSCIAERKAALLDFKKAARSVQMSEESLMQNNTEFAAAQQHRIEYLSRDTVQADEIKRLFEQLAIAQKHTTDVCNSFLENSLAELEALRELAKYYPVSNIDPAIRGDCQEVAWQAGKFANYDSEEIARLATNKSYRDDFVEGERINLTSNRHIAAAMGEVIKAQAKERAARYTQVAEEREGSFAFSVCDCLNIHLGTDSTNPQANNNRSPLAESDF